MQSAGSFLNVVSTYEILKLLTDLNWSHLEWSNVEKIGSDIKFVTCCHKDDVLYPSWQGFDNSLNSVIFRGPLKETTPTSFNWLAVLKLSSLIWTNLDEDSSSFCCNVSMSV